MTDSQEQQPEDESLPAPADGPEIDAARQQALEATSAAMDDDPDLDVEGRLREELAQRNVTITDVEALHELTDRIRQRPGSLGGDNGGG